MNLEVAKSLLTRDRMDWRKPHLTWLSNKLYRQFRWTSNG